MNIPYHRQINDYACGPATLQMIFEYFGTRVSQEKILSHTYKKSSSARGTSHRELMGAARHYGFVCREHIRASVSDIRRYLAHEIPVIVNFFEPVENIAHYAVVVGATDKELILNDPDNGRNFRIDIVDFEKRWFNSTKRSKRWFLVVTPKRVSF